MRPLRMTRLAATQLPSLAVTNPKAPPSSDMPTDPLRRALTTRSFTSNPWPNSSVSWNRKRRPGRARLLSSRFAGLNARLGGAFDAAKPKGGLQRDFFQMIEAPGRAAMPRTHVGLEQDRPSARHLVAKLGDPFERLPIGDTRIGETAERENWRVGFCLDVVVG